MAAAGRPRIGVWLTALVALLVLPAPAAAAPTGAGLGRYIVRVRAHVRVDDVAANARARGAKVRFVYRHALSGFAADLSAAELTRLRKDPAVDEIVPDTVMYASDTQSSPDWGLDRVDQRNLPLDQAYHYNSNAGEGVTVYVIDSGIAAGHPDFGTRRVSGVDEVGGVSPPTDDCDGHGTHVAGTIGGTRYGVAKQATLVAVRVLDCRGVGFASTVIAGIDWVTGDHQPGQAAVANMSLGGPASSLVDSAVAKSVIDGVVYVAAAGNGDAFGNGVDACGGSPADLGGTNGPIVDVAATDETDTRAVFSDYGSCVDVFAPGVHITSDWVCSSGVCYVATATGTSMAAPHVAGIAALYIAENPTAKPAQVKSAIATNATAGVVYDPAGSPNLLAWNFSSPVAPSPPTRVNAIALDTKAKLSWGAALANGSAVTGYTVTAAPGTATASVAGGQLNATVVGLTNGVSYTFTVTATNAIGTSSPSSASNSVIPAGVPFAPTGVTGAAQNAGALVAWQAASGNGRTVTAYTVTASPGGASVIVGGDQRSARVSGLVAAASYAFEVRATNAIGAGAWSTPSSTVAITRATPYTYTANYTDDQYAFLGRTAAYFHLPIDQVPKAGVGALAYILAITHTTTQTPIRPVPADGGNHAVEGTWTAASDSVVTTVATHFSVNGDQAHWVGGVFMMFVAVLEGVH